MYTDLCLAHPLESWAPFDIVVNSAHAFLTAPVTYKPTNISNSPFRSLSGTSAYREKKVSTWWLFIRRLNSIRFIGIFCSLPKRVSIRDLPANHVELSLLFNYHHVLTFFSLTFFKVFPKPIYGSILNCIIIIVSTIFLYPVF